MQLLQRFPLVLDDLFELTNPLIGVLFEAGLDEAPVAQTRLELLNHFAVVVIDSRHAVQGFGAPLEELREAILDEMRVLRALMPLLKIVAEFVDLRLKFGEAELDVRCLLLHSLTLGMIHDGVDGGNGKGFNSETRRHGDLSSR